MPEVSIIIINYNTFELTTKCIDSIYKYAEGLKFEIILVDNASSECSPDEFKKIFMDIILVKSKENLGFSKGNNLGLKYAQADKILLLNSDTYFIDNSLIKAMNVFKEKENIHVLTGKLLYPDGRTQHQCGKFPSIKLQILELFRIQKFLPKGIAEKLFLGTFFDHESSIYPETIWGTFFLFRRQVLTSFENNTLPDKYFMYAEDIDWCFKIMKKKYKIYYDPSIKIIHYFSASNCSNKKYLMQNNFNDVIIENKGKLYFLIFNFFLNINLTVERWKKSISLMLSL